MNGNEPRDYVVIKDTGIPYGLVKDQRDKAKNGLKNGVGKHSHTIPAKITGVRPNIESVYERDEEGEVIGIVEAPTGWIVAGDFSEEGWQTEQDVHDAFAGVLADYLEAPLPPITSNISVTVMNHDEIQAELRDYAEFWSEQTE